MKRVGISGLTGMIGKNLITQYAGDPQTRETLELVAFIRKQSDTTFLEQSGNTAVSITQIETVSPASWRTSMHFCILPV